MKRNFLGVVVLACVLGVAAPSASAKLYELGESSTPAPPSCPDDCRVVTKTTALQVSTAGRAYPTTVPTDGRIVALTVQLGLLTERQVRRLNRAYGGTPRVQLTVLSQDSRQRPRRFFTVSAQSEIFRVTDYLGTTAQFALERSLAVRRGDFIALTVPTWAPTLAVSLDDTNSWRASRTARCDDPVTFVQQTAQLVVGNEAQYKCLYRTAKVTYSATMISTPKARRLGSEQPARRESSSRTTDDEQRRTTTR